MSNEKKFDFFSFSLDSPFLGGKTIDSIALACAFVLRQHLCQNSFVSWSKSRCPNVITQFPFSPSCEHCSFSPKPNLTQFQVILWRRQFESVLIIGFFVSFQVLWKASGPSLSGKWNSFYIKSVKNYQSKSSPIHMKINCEVIFRRLPIHFGRNANVYDKFAGNICIKFVQMGRHTISFRFSLCTNVDIAWLSQCCIQPT